MSFHCHDETANSAIRETWTLLRASATTIASGSCTSADRFPFVPDSGHAN